MLHAKGLLGYRHFLPVEGSSAPLYSLLVFVAQGAKPQVNGMVGIRRPEICPSGIEMFVWGMPHSVDVFAHRKVGVDLLSRKGKIRVISGHEHGVRDYVYDRFDDGDETMGPAPPVVAAPPFSI